MKIRVNGIFDRYNNEVDVDKKCNILIGENGIGKSTTLKIVKAFLSGDFVELLNYYFNSIEVIDHNKNVKINYVDLFPKANDILNITNEYVIDSSLEKESSWINYNKCDIEKYNYKLLGLVEENPNCYQHLIRNVINDGNKFSMDGFREEYNITNNSDYLRDASYILNIFYLRFINVKDYNNIRYIDGSNAGANEKDKWLSESKQPEHITNSDDWKDWHGISKDQEWFYGDVVEFIPSDYKEYVIANVNYRFNSYQRENPNKNFVCDGVLRYHNIISDDYDFNADFKIDDVYKYTYAEQEPRREGYFYNPHYPIRMKEEGEVQQGSHYTVRARNVIVVQDDDIRLKVVSMQTSNVNVNDIVLLMDDKNSQMFEFIVVYIESSNTFYITPRNGWFGDNGFIEQTAQIYEAPLVWSDVAELLRRGENMFIRRRNIEIPSYAVLAGRNIFLWRNYYNNGELLNGKIPEYIFTNNAFYVTPVINFYVKRQDPNGYFGLYTPETQNPQDIAGETKKPSNYSYNDPETKATC